MLVHPDINPIAVSLGPIKVHWYGLMYLVGFWGAWWMATVRARWPHVGWPKERVSDILFYIVLGVILGGRIGYTFFYNFDDQGQLVFLHDPLVIFRIWQGGMSFHGGLIGVIVSMIVFAWQRGLKFWDVADFVAVVVPFGLFTGRIGNFINSELWGAPTTLPWGMVFPATDNSGLARHPSMLYEAFLEGLVMLAILWWVGRKPRPRGTIAGLFLLLYSVFRFAIEFVRVPDRQLGYLYGTTWFTMGMQLCVPMFVFGLAVIIVAYSRKQYAPVGDPAA
jgi:phosphatidylglycerol:prolipoprotein diacylglycerol transferase